MYHSRKNIVQPSATRVRIFCLSSMMNSVAGHVVRVPVRSSPKRLLLLADQVDSKHHSCQLSNGFSKLRQLRFGPKITEMMKERLSLGANFLQVGGSSTRFFKRNFVVREEEKLSKTFRCYLSTTAGPIAGLLFISSDRIAFCSEKSITIPSPTSSEELVKLNYKVSIPLKKIKKGRESKNVNMPSKKYIEIVTVDDFDFWFMGFQNHQKTFRFIQQAILQVHH